MVEFGCLQAKHIFANSFQYRRKKSQQVQWTVILRNKTLLLLLLLLLSAFPFSQGWPQRIITLQTFLSSTSVSFAPTSLISSFTTSKNQIVSLVSLFFSFPVTPFPSSFFLHKQITLTNYIFL